MDWNDLEATEVRLDGERRALEIEWRGGASNLFHADQLRQACRCAECVRARIDGAFAPLKELAIAKVALVGSYALNLQFSDGHARGIYPWSYLREIAAQA